MLCGQADKIPCNWLSMGTEAPRIDCSSIVDYLHFSQNFAAASYSTIIIFWYWSTFALRNLVHGSTFSGLVAAFLASFESWSSTVINIINGENPLACSTLLYPLCRSVVPCPHSNALQLAPERFESSPFNIRRDVQRYPFPDWSGFWLLSAWWTHSWFDLGHWTHSLSMVTVNANMFETRDISVQVLFTLGTKK